MKSYEDLFPDVLPDLPGCPPEIALRAIRHTVIEFCEKSLIHQVTLDPITVMAGFTQYDFDVPKGFRVQKIMKAWFKGLELEPVAPDSIRAPDAYSTVIGGYRATETPPVAYTQLDFSTVSFLPTPDRKYPSAVTMRVALAPLRDSTEFVDFLYEQWGEFLACGAKARLMLSPGKPYSNNESAVVNQGRYTTALNDARQRAIHGNVRSGLSVRMRKP